MLDALLRLGVTEPTDGDIRSLRGRTSTFIAGEGRDSRLLGVEARGGTPAGAVKRSNALAEAMVAWDQRRATESLTRVITTLDQQINALGEQIRVLQSSVDGAAQPQVDGLIRLRAEQQQQLAYARALVASAEGLLSVMQPAGTTPRQIAAACLRRRHRGAPRHRRHLRAAPAPECSQHASRERRRHRQCERAQAARRVPEAWTREGRLAAAGSRELPSDERPLRHGGRASQGRTRHEHEGKTSVACQLAEGLARNGYRTLLVDADLRSPSIGAYQVLGSRRVAHRCSPVGITPHHPIVTLIFSTTELHRWLVRVDDG